MREQSKYPARKKIKKSRFPGYLQGGGEDLHIFALFVFFHNVRKNLKGVWLKVFLVLSPSLAPAAVFLGLPVTLLLPIYPRCPWSTPSVCPLVSDRDTQPTCAPTPAWGFPGFSGLCGSQREGATLQPVRVKKHCHSPVIHRSRFILSSLAC